jgi:hypothetical protein
MSTSENTEREPAVSWLHRAIEPPNPLSSKLCFDCRAVDSTGIKAEGEGEWNARKHGGSKRRVWRKIHIGIDEETLEVWAVEVTGRNIGDAPLLPKLLNQIPSDQDIGSVTADGAYDTRKCHEAIAARDAHAVVPPRKNAKPWKPTSAGAIARNDAVNAQRYLGRTLWRRWSGRSQKSKSASPSSITTLLLVYLSRNL